VIPFDCAQGRHHQAQARATLSCITGEECSPQYNWGKPNPFDEILEEQNSEQTEQDFTKTQRKQKESRLPPVAGD
jgi:hypothetical protein